MSIAVTGPAMYDFQDLVCVDFILRFYQKKEVSFFVEPDGGEDARLSFREEGCRQSRFEIQVKGSQEAVTLRSLAECLAHYPARSATNSLLEQLLADDDMVIVLVMFGRAVDSVQKYLPRREWCGALHSENIFTLGDAQNLLAELQHYSDSLPITKLNNKRKSHTNNFLNSVSSKDLKPALRRLIVLEKVTLDSLTTSCNRVLRDDFNIPDDLLKVTINGLLDGIKESKLQRDAVPLIFQKLNENPITSVRPKNYVLRNQEEAWVNQLAEQNVLLLSGKPRVGKSNTAQWIAGEFQKKGYAILLKPSIDEAERYLQDTVTAPRLVVLDDPLGNSRSIATLRRTAVLRQLKTLVSGLRQNRKLIIAQGQERLLEVSESETLVEAGFRGYHWVDLSVYTVHFLLNCWDLLSKDFSINEQLSLKVSEAIETEKVTIEPGCLTYLAAEHEKIDPSSSIESIIRFSRKDADDLGRELADDGCKNVLIGLALTTTHLESVREVDLSYVLSAKGDAEFGYTGNVVTNIFGRDKGKNEFPHYPDKQELTSEDSESLDLLELRRIIELIDYKQASLIFSHPYYKAAAESLCNVSTRRSFGKVEHILTNGLFCLSPATARATARNLYWVYDKTKSEAFKGRIVDKAILGLNSSYPSVRDLCFEFLSDTLESLDNTYREKLEAWIHKVYGKDLEILEWANGEPWYPMGKSVSATLTWERMWGKEDTGKILDVLKRDADTPLSPKDFYDLLKYLEGKPGQLTQILMSRVLSVNEGLIRALAAKIWIDIDRTNDSEILDRIFSDKHPAVAKSAFKSAIRSWSQFDESRQSYMSLKLIRVSHHPVVAHAIIDDLVVFERPNNMGENPPWEIFSKLLPIALSSLSSTKRFDYARLDCVAREAAKILPLESFLSILEVWLDLLEELAKDTDPDDYAFGVVDHFFASSGKNHALRHGVVRRLLAMNGTGPLVRVISDLTEYWTDLSDEEKELVKDTLLQERIDEKWLKAAVLTSRDAPLELINLVTKKEHARRLETQDILNLEPGLLATSFKMYIGKPQPLWWFATHHREECIWPNIAENLSLVPDHALFKTAFLELLGTWDTQKICNVIEKLDSGHAETLFSVTVNYYINSNPEFMPEVMKAIFNLSKDKRQHSRWIKTLASNTLVIFDSLSDAGRLIPDEKFDEYKSHFLNDIAILGLLEVSQTVLKKSFDDMKNIVLENLKSVFELTPPSHYSVCSLVSDTLRSSGFSESEVSFANQKRRELLDKAHSWDKVDEEEQITNWQFNSVGCSSHIE